MFNKFNKFKRETGGNVAIMFALTISTIVIAVGAAVDYSGISSQKQDLQDAIDGATLAAARANITNEAKLKKIVEEFVEQSDPSPNKIKLDVKVIDDEVYVTAKTVYDTVLMGFIGQKAMDVQVAAASPIASKTPIKLALVLDTTTSMEGNRIASLKVAANAMVDEFEENNTTAAVSVIPFGKYVNVGMNQNRENWLDISKDGTSETEEVCWDERRTTKPRECTETGRTIYYDDIRDGVNFGQNSYQEQTCTAAEYEYTGNRICEDRTTTYTWHGCVGSRNAPYNERAAFGSQRIPGIMNETCGTELQPLTTNMTDVKSKISSLNTNGNTYIPAGVVWGWRTLQDKAPFKTDVKLKSDNKRQVESAKVMLIMTDGANTLSQGGNETFKHDSSDKLEANARTLALCNAAKDDGIMIFTLGFKLDASDTATKTMLENCATTPAGFFQAGDGPQLKKAFKDIAGQLDFTRLSI